MSDSELGSPAASWLETATVAGDQETPKAILEPGAQPGCAAMAAPTEGINLSLKAHQVGAADWEYRRLMADLHTWAERMNVEFKLDTGISALAIARIRRTSYGHYHIGRNGFGLRGEIVINEIHLKTGPRWQSLGTLLHELLHYWQEIHGRPAGANSRNHHNGEFRAKAATLGLLVDRRGVTRYANGDTPFRRLLGQHGVVVPEIGEAPAPEPPAPGAAFSEGCSKLLLYVCECKPPFRVRSGRRDLRAKCLKCGAEFKRPANGGSGGG